MASSKARTVCTQRLFSLVLVSILTCNLALPPAGLAQLVQTNFNLPPPGQIVKSSSRFTPPLLRGITIDADNPFRFDFIVTSGDQKLKGDQLKTETEKLIKYFMTAVTVPDQDIWVNLSPYDKDRIVPERFGLTGMGQDLLAQDYLLKQLTASLVYPEDSLGQKFWAKVYEDAYAKYGTTQIPVNTFNKVWILADSATVYESGNTAFVTQSRLKVMLEDDFLALSQSRGDHRFGPAKVSDEKARKLNEISAKVLRDIVLPAIEKEVNEGENFVQLRQVYHSVILATWFKNTLKESLLGKVYADQSKMAGVENGTSRLKDELYQQYLTAFKTGVYNYIREDLDAVTQRKIPRKYFSGGTDLTSAMQEDPQTGQQNPVQLWQAIDLRRVDGLSDSLEVAASLQQAGGATLAEVNLNPATGASSQVKYVPWAFPSQTYNRGTDSPEWAQAFIVSNLILKNGNGVQADELSGSAFDAFSKGYWVSTGQLSGQEMARREQQWRDGFWVMLNGLRNRGLVDSDDRQTFRPGQGQRVLLKASPRTIAIWGRDIEFLNNDIKKALAIGPEAFYKIIDEYEQIIDANSNKFLVEPKFPVLWAISMMAREQHQRIVDLLLTRSTQNRKRLAGAIILMLDFERGSKDWLAVWAPYLKGRSLVMTAPEIALLAGGLGRVMLFHGIMIKLLGGDVRFHEPFYMTEEKDGKLVDVDYSKVPIPVRNLQRLAPDHKFSTIVKGGEVEFEVYWGVNDYDIPVYLIRDTGRWYVRLLYKYKKEKSPSDFMEFAEFFTKADLELTRFLEGEKRQAMGPNYKAPLLDPNDGQALPQAAFLKLFYRDMDRLRSSGVTADEIDQLKYTLGNAMVDAVTHTVKNRQIIWDWQAGINWMRAAGIPEQYFWLALRKSDDGRIVVDLSSLGLRSADAARGVSAVHANLMNPLDPGINLVGLTNGDNLQFTRWYFNQVAQRLGIGIQDADYMTKEQLTQIKRQAKVDMGLNPDQMLVSTNGRLVPEKFEIPDEVIWGMVKAGVQFWVNGNVQDYDDSRWLGDRLTRLSDAIQKAKVAEPAQYPGNFIFRSFTSEEQRMTLTASDVQVQISSLDTEASGSFESNSRAVGAVQIGPAFWEGNLQGAVYNHLTGIGDTLVPASTNPKDLLDAIVLANQYYLSGELTQIQINSLRAGRAHSGALTAMEDLLFWNDMFKDNARNSPKPRLAGEVRLAGSQFRTFLPGQTKTLVKDGNTVKIVPGERKDVEVEVTVDLKTRDVVTGQEGFIDFSLVKGVLVSDYGVEIPLNLKKSQGHQVLLSATIPEDVALPFQGQIKVTSGMWYETEDVRIEEVASPDVEILRWLRKEVRANGQAVITDDVLRQFGFNPGEQGAQELFNDLVDAVLERNPQFPRFIFSEGPQAWVLPGSMGAAGNISLDPAVLDDIKTGVLDVAFTPGEAFTEADFVGAVFQAKGIPQEYQNDVSAQQILEGLVQADVIVAVEGQPGQYRIPPGGILLDPTTLKLTINRAGSTISLPPYFGDTTTLMKDLKGFDINILNMTPFSLEQLPGK